MPPPQGIEMSSTVCVCVCVGGGVLHMLSKFEINWTELVKLLDYKMILIFLKHYTSQMISIF